MAGLGEAEDHTPPAVAVDGRRSSVQSNGHSPAEMSVGMKKRRPASPEVVIPARPRTPSSNGNTSFEQSQSPTKKQRTEHKMFQLDMQLVDASMFTSRSAEGAIESMHTVPGSATIGPADAGLVSTTETFAFLSTVTPNKRSRQESATVPSDAAEAGPSSKPASPHSRRQSNVVVEIPHSRPGSALAQRDSPSRVAERAAITISRPSSPIAPSEEEGIFPGANSPRTADDTISSTAPSPELEEVPSAKSRSRKIPPQPDLPRSSPSVQRRRSPISSSSKSLNAEAELLMSPRSASLETDSSTALPNHTSNKDRTAVNKSSPAKAFNSPNDPWFAKPSRKAAATRKTYAEDTSNSSDEDEEPYVANSASNLAQRGSKAASHGSRKGKERAIEDQNASPSRTAEQPQAMGTNGHTPAKAEKKFKQRGSTSVPKKKAALPKSKSDTHLTGKGKTKGRRKGSTSSGSSDIEDFFNVHSPSPSKPKKKTTTRKKPTPAKKAALSQAAKAPHLSAKPISGGSSDDDLPTLPFSSQPPSQSQATSTFDLLDIDDIAFVSVPARRKAEVHTLTPPNDHIVHFWWPARIINRNRKNFTVSLIFGDPDQDRNFFPDDTFVLAESDLDGDHLQKLSSRCNPFPSFSEAFEGILNHPEVDSYALPSSSAYASALCSALKRERDIAHTTTAIEANVAVPSPTEDTDDTSTASELDLLKGSRAAFSSDTEDDESDIQVGTIGLGKNRNVWWPCRIIKTLSQDGTASQSRNPRDRRRPYKVEFYPKSTASLSRKDIMLKSDPDFFTVPLGEIQTSEISSLLPRATLREILPEMVQTASGRYAADQKRHAYFIDGTATERSGLSRMAVYGQFERKQVDQISDFLSDWAFGRIREVVSIPVDAPFHTFASDEQKSNYVALVLLPVALELLVIKDDPEIDQKARTRLIEAGNTDPTEEQLRITAHKVAAEDLEASTDWWDSILTLRRAHQAGKFVKEAMRTELDDEDLAAMGLATRRRKVNVNYKE